MNNVTHKLVFSALGIAIITIATAFLHFNIGVAFVSLSDVFIFVISIIFGPIVGLLSAGFGSFFGDMIAYPTTMFFSLIIKGLEGLVIGLIAYRFKNSSKKHTFIWLFAMFIGSIIMIGGYFLTKALFYGTLETALISLLPNVLQALIGIISAILILNILPNNVFKL